MRFLSLVAALSLLVTTPAEAFVRIVTEDEGRVRIGAVDVLYDEAAGKTTVTLRVRVTGRARAAALLFAVPAGAHPSPAGQARADDQTIDTLRRKTAPRFDVVDAVEPCPAGTEMNPGPPRAYKAPEPIERSSGRWTTRVVSMSTLKSETEGLPAVPADEFAALDAAVGPDGQIIALIGGLERTRGAWLPAVQFAVDGGPPVLRASLGADLTPTGQTQKVTVITRSVSGLLRPVSGKLTPMAPIAHFPEVALETPVDLQRAVRHHASRRHGPDTIVTEYEARFGRPPELIRSLGRYYFEQGARSPQGVLRLARTSVREPMEPHWTFRRIWREPLACKNDAFRVIVQQQQRTELKTYAVATGRRLAEISAQSFERGYGMKADGTVAPVEFRKPETLTDL